MLQPLDGDKAVADTGPGHSTEEPLATALRSRLSLSEAADFPASYGTCLREQTAHRYKLSGGDSPPASL